MTKITINPRPSASVNINTRPRVKFTLTENGIAIGPEGKSAYASYLEKTEDNPPLTYVEWALLLPELKSQIEDLKIDINTLKSEADAVQEYDSFLVFPNVGAPGIIFIDTTENISYRWDKDLLKYYKINAIEIDIIDGNLN